MDFDSIYLIVFEWCECVYTGARHTAKQALSYPFSSEVKIIIIIIITQSFAFKINFNFNKINICTNTKCG